MEIIWERGEVTVAGLWEELAAKREIARSTVQTLVVRMRDKGWIEHRVEGNRFVYSAAVPRDASIGHRLRDFIDGAFGGSPEQLVSALLEHQDLSKAEVKRIRRLIDDAASAQRKRGSR